MVMCQYLGTLVYFDMANNIAEGNFQIIYQHVIFHFLSAKIEIFCEASTKNMVQMTPIELSHKLGHIMWINPEYYEFSCFLYNFAHLDNFMSIFRK